jgi:hypothetical protein
MYFGTELRACAKRGRLVLSIAVYGVLTVLPVMLIAVVGLEAVQRAVPASLRREHNDVAGCIYAVVGVV